jgi:nitrogenase molybdenum-iron protein alpha chain
MRPIAKNPFLPKRTVRWIKGPFAEKRPETRANGNKSPDSAAKPRRWGSPAGRMLHIESPSHSFGDNLDMLALSHGAVGCGALHQLTRLHMPGFVQGIESFTSLHASTDLVSDDLTDAGDVKLARALDEALELFPLTKGIMVQDNCKIGWLEPNVRAIIKEKRKASGRLIVADTFGLGSNWAVSTSSTLKAAAGQTSKAAASGPYDVALTFAIEASALIWIVAKLLQDIGLNPVPVFGATINDITRVTSCKLVIGWRLAKYLHEILEIPTVDFCFANPNATDESLRRIAGHFDDTIQENAERVIARNRKKVDAVIARYKPLFEKKLFLSLEGYPDSALENFRMLGFRVGDCRGWPSFYGIPHVHRNIQRSYDYARVHAEAVSDARPDVVFDSYDRDDLHWAKRGQTALPFSYLYDREGHAFWGYDGFELLAKTLARHINAPWRKLVKSPWPQESG